MNKQQTGFTLIELIAVIVILGILAATALPKFVSVASDARVASVNAAAGAMKSAANMAHAKFLINPAATSDTFEGVTVTYVLGYPDAGSINALSGLASDYTVNTSGSSATAAVTTNCLATYTEATAGTGNTVNPPVVTVTTSGC